MSCVSCSVCSESKKIPEMGPRKKDKKASKKGKENIKQKNIKKSNPICSVKQTGLNSVLH